MDGERRWHCCRRIERQHVGVLASPAAAVDFVLPLVCGDLIRFALLCVVPSSVAYLYS